MLKSRYQHFGDQTAEHIVVLQELITAIGGDPGYVSPSARAMEKLDHGALEATFMLDGSVDVLTRELLMLDAVVLAETVDHANWQSIAAMGDALGTGPAKDAFAAATARVGPEEDDHIGWATQRRAQLVHLQATRPVVTAVAATAETAMEWVKGWFADDPS
jgi:hypothetical protein